MPSLRQPTLFELSDGATLPKSASIADAIEELASNSGTGARGAIFTRVEVVEFILDLVGYTDDRPLHQYRILEPSCGNGDFLLPVVDRLLASWRNGSGNTSAVTEELGEAVCGVELHRRTYEGARKSVIERLMQWEIPASAAAELAERWLTQGDFLLEAEIGRFDFVVGNPPYVRQELIPAVLLAEYRRRYSTMYDRADLYIAFIERSLSLLDNGGTLGFICADRWMKNRYGGPLRKFISRGFHFKAYVDMVNTLAFHAEVIAYPAITIISKERAGATRIAHRPRIDKPALTSIAAEILSPALPTGSAVREMSHVVNDSEPWLIESSDQMALIRRIEDEYPSLEEAGCKVGIGVATGADKAFIGDFDSLDVETDRKLPLVMTGDLESGEVVWRGLGVINPFANDGGLVDLGAYPKLARYLEERKEVIAKRHCAQKAPRNWYRTIDRIWPALTERPKLLIPDIKGEAHVVFESGKLYPHHNLYYVTSDTWDLRALQAVLLSSVAKLFVATYSTKMRGGYLRFQAQYLRRIRIPRWQHVCDELRHALMHAAESRDLEACNNAVFRLYNLNQEERSALGGNGE